MSRAFLPKALAFTVLTAGLTMAGAQQPQTDQAPAPAQGHHRHAPNPQRQAAMLGRRLNLSPDQTARLEPILADRDQKLQALFGNQQLTPEDRHQQMQTIRKQTQDQLSTVLSPDQMQQLKSMRRGEHHHEDGAEANPAPTV